MIEYANLTKSGHGREKFNDKILPYIVYEIPDWDWLQTPSYKWFADGDKVVGVRIFDNRGNAGDVVFVVFESTVDDSVFEIPDDYTLLFSHTASDN
jgi:hypothetical protein